MIGWLRISAISFAAAALFLIAFVGGFVTAARYDANPTAIEWDTLKGTRFQLITSAVLKTLGPQDQNAGSAPRVVFSPARSASLMGGEWDFRDALTFRFYNHDGSVGPSGWAGLAGKGDGFSRTDRQDVWVYREGAAPLIVEFNRWGNIVDVDS